ncbi:MAG: hypothetical protein K8R59_07180 [Thermoanaerobaculales bacterium]|nr:hypothetical protein [Thermoanaerobaculales bacterium]
MRFSAGTQRYGIESTPTGRFVFQAGMMLLFFLVIALCNDLSAASGTVSLSIRIEPGVRELLAGKTSSTLPAEMVTIEKALSSCRESLAHHLNRAEVSRIMESIINDSIVITPQETWLSSDAHRVVVQTIDGVVYAL